MKLATTKEATKLAIDTGLGRRVLAVHFDHAKKVHRITVAVAEAKENGRYESQNYYVMTDDEVLAQELAVNLATTNFLGKTNSYLVTPTSNNAQTMEESHGNSHQESNEENCEETSEGKEPVSKKKSSSKKSVKQNSEAGSVNNKTAVQEQSDPAEEMEEVDSPFKARPEEKAIPYSRTNERHIDVLTSFLTKLVGGDSWKQHPNITQFSISLVGKPFVDSEGNIVPSFAEECTRFFGIKTSNGL